MKTSSEAAARFETDYAIPVTDLRLGFDYAQQNKDVTSREVQLDMLDACETEGDQLELLGYLIECVPSAKIDIIPAIRCPKGASEWLAGAAKWHMMRAAARQFQQRQVDHEFCKIVEVDTTALIFRSA